MKAFVAGLSIVLMATSATAQTSSATFAHLYQPDDSGLHLRPNMTRSLELERLQERQREERLTTAPEPARTATARPADVTRSILGALQYHWAEGQKPELGIRGLPMRAKVSSKGVFLGLSYRP